MCDKIGVNFKKNNQSKANSFFSTVKCTRYSITEDEAMKYVFKNEIPRSYFHNISQDGNIPSFRYLENIVDCCTQVQFSSRVVQVPAPSGFSFGNVEVKDDHGHLQQYWYGLFYDCIFLKGYYCAKRFISNGESGESLIDYDEKVGVFNESGHLVLGESLSMVNIGKSSQENYYHKGEFWGDQAVTLRRGDVRICLPDQEVLSIKNGVFNKLGEPVRDA